MLFLGDHISFVTGKYQISEWACVDVSVTSVVHPHVYGPTHIHIHMMFTLWIMKQLTSMNKSISTV
jgi:hypothetical protein